MQLKKPIYSEDGDFVKLTFYFASAQKQLLDKDDVILRLANKKHELDVRRAGLVWKYYNKIKTELNPIDAAMFYQVESQLLMLIDVQVAGEIPIIKKPKN